MPPRSRHLLVSSDLVRRLQRGEWPVGSKFPTVDELLQDYEFSRGTIFKGIQQLISEGYLQVRKGVGTFVLRTMPVQNIGLLINETCLEPQKTPFPYVLSQKLISLLESEDFSVLRFVESKSGSPAGCSGIENLAESLKNHLLRGMVMFNCNFPVWMSKCPVWQEFGVPYVTLHTYGQSDFRIDYDYENMLQQAFRYFSDRGRSNIAAFCGTDILPLAERARTFFPELNIASEFLVPITSLSSPEQVGFQLLSQLWLNGKHPDALFVSDDIVTKGVVQAALCLGIRIPEELLILHAANSDTDVFYPVPMPKLEFNLDESAVKAVEMLKYSMIKMSTNTHHFSRKITPLLIDTDYSSVKNKTGTIREKASCS